MPLLPQSHSNTKHPQKPKLLPAAPSSGVSCRQAVPVPARRPVLCCLAGEEEQHTLKVVSCVRVSGMSVHRCLMLRHAGTRFESVEKGGA